MFPGVDYVCAAAVYFNYSENEPQARKLNRPPQNLWIQFSKKCLISVEL